MRLSRDVSGTFDQAKDSLQRDFITLQRNYDQLQQQITSQLAQITTLNAKFLAQNLAASAAGQISGINAAQPLRTIAHDTTLMGLGTPASPLSVVSSGSSSATGVLFQQTLITNAQFAAAATTPISLLGGSAGQVYIPMWVSLNWKVTNAYSNSPSWRWGYTGSAGNFMATLTPGMGSAGTFYSTNAAIGYNGVTTTSVYSGKGIEITLNIAPTPIVSPASNMNAVVTIAYYPASVVI